MGRYHGGAMYRLRQRELLFVATVGYMPEMTRDAVSARSRHAFSARSQPFNFYGKMAALRLKNASLNGY
jgi:hypothetical protein